MELPPKDFQANIVDYFENMRDTHWNPRFVQLSLDLAGRLLSVRASCTSHSVDCWPEAQLTLLTPPGQSPTTTSFPSSSPSGRHLATFHLLKHIITNSVPLEAVFQTTPFTAITDTPNLDNWPQVQQYFSRLRSLIFTSRRAPPLPPPPPPPPSLPQPPLPSAALFNPLTLQPSTTLPLLLLTQPNPCFLPASSTPILTAPTPPLPLTGNLLMDILALTAPSPQVPLQMPALPTPLTFPQATLQQIMSPVPPHLLHAVNEQQTQKNCFNHLQVVCFKDEAKTRFMCSKCSKQWTSMKGAITFVVIMSHQTTPTMEVVAPQAAMEGATWSSQGCVTLRPGANVLLELFPQACAECALHGEVRLSPPKWYPEEVDKVLRNLFVNIHRTFYKNVIFWEQQFDRRRRPGHPTGRHDNTKCLACLNGMCVSAISQSPSQSQVLNGESASQSNQSECSPACKRRLIPPTKNNLKRLENVSSSTTF
ncbi:receptor transporting protein [Echinococcus multilocularis]|uniref:Receptor transporting protein n=1 Tax=Echinococcus multilocularis TaxID=6211 RepID=A0A068YGC6_ECHMU|nr:receptor transporting protein [Echinococcus multilocularis]